jgi:hypothetical protein
MDTMMIIVAPHVSFGPACDARGDKDLLLRQQDA